MNQLKKTDVWVTESETVVSKLHVNDWIGNKLIVLEKLPNQYCFTEEELGNIVCDIFTEGHKKGWLRGADGHSGYTKDDAQKFLNNLFKPTTNEKTT